MKTLLFIVLLGFTGLALADDNAQTKQLQATIHAQSLEIAKLNAKLMSVLDREHQLVGKYKYATSLALEWKTLALELQAELDVVNTPTTNSTVIVTPMAPGSYLVRDANGKSRIVTEGVPGVYTTR
jgi:hypothetical protein